MTLIYLHLADTELVVLDLPTKMILEPEI